MASIVLLGLDKDLAESLQTVLDPQEHNILITNDASRASGAELVFAAGDDPCYRETVRRLTGAVLRSAVIVVSRHADSARWLDALEAGAADYCSVPLEPIQMRW